MEPDRRNEKIARAVREAGTVDRGLTQNAARVLERRYLSKDRKGRVQEDPEGMFRRVAGNLSKAELNYGEAREERRRMVEDEFHTVMSRLDFLPNSPTLMNAGRELQQLSACFVLPVEDSLDGIFSTVKQTALIHKSGGGTGFSFNRLRPAGDLVGSTGGVASGPVSFIGAFDAATDVVKQGSTRRGANMAILNVDHPDILEFIRAKQDPGRLLNFNISVGITEDFMERWRREEDYDLINPRTGERTGSLNTRDVFSQIVDSAWATGDPGLVFLDRINEGNPNPQLGRIESTNPCVTGDTWAMTAQGPRQVSDLMGKQQVLLVNGQPHATCPEGFFPTGVKPVIAIETEEGHRITLTPNHQVRRVRYEPYNNEGIHEWVQAGELRPGDAVALHDHRQAHRRGNSILPMGKVSQPILKSLQEVFTKENIVLDLRDESGPALCLRNLAPGLLSNAQRELSYLGIRSSIQLTTRTDGEPSPMMSLRAAKDGSVEVKETREGEQELVIRGGNLERFTLQVGSPDSREQHYLGELALIVRDTPGYLEEETHTTTIASIEDAGEAEVYDVQVPGINAFDANGLYVHNCGEEPLLPYESCNLGSVNLARMLQVNDEETLEIDWERLRRVITTGVRMLDNVIDMNQFPIEEIGEMSRLTRRIGLGVMGWADLLVQLGIRYDSEEALELARELMGFIQRETHRASAELAEERGTFPAWEGSVYTTPMRNSAPVTIAPTGTISIIAGASSGIEPLFALSYVRNVMDSTRLVEVNPYFEAVARQEGFYTPELMEQVAETGSLEELDPASSTGQAVPQWVKDIFRTSHDISPVWHVLMQAAFQAHTDNAVSKTINMPAEATREDVQEAYLLAYIQNCKGITVYRDGSKADQVLSTGARAPEKAALEKADEGILTPRDRPRTMRGVTERFRTGHGNMYITVNFDEDSQPFEIFAALGKAGGCDSANLEAVSRLASLCLRTGLEPREIIYNLQGITCCPAWDEGVQISSAPDAMANMLRLWEGRADPGSKLPLPQQRGREDSNAAPQAISRLRCPECNARVVFQEGCEACSNPACGWNRCY